MDLELTIQSLYYRWWNFSYGKQFQQLKSNNRCRMSSSQFDMLLIWFIWMIDDDKTQKSLWPYPMTQSQMGDVDLWPFDRALKWCLLHGRWQSFWLSGFRNNARSYRNLVYYNWFWCRLVIQRGEFIGGVVTLVGHYYVAEHPEMDIEKEFGVLSFRGICLG